MEIRQELIPGYFLWSFPVGFLLGAVYDVFRLARKCRRRGSFADTVLCVPEDLLFGTFSGIILTLTAYALNCGRVRFLTFAADLAGFLLWRALPGRLLMAAAEKGRSAVKKAAARLSGNRRGKKKGSTNDARKRKNVVLRKDHRASLHRGVRRDDRASADAVQ